MSKWIVSCPRCRQDIYTTDVEPVPGAFLVARDFKHIDGRQVSKSDPYGCLKCGLSFSLRAPVPGRDIREVEDGVE